MPGEPYRPLTAMPSQIRQVAPWFSFCTPGYFTAYDPPTTLRAATAFGPGPTPTDDTKPQLLAPEPSITPDPGARKTAAGAGSIPIHTDGPIVDKPKAKAASVPTLNLGKPGIGSSNPQQSSNSGQGSNTGQNNDPKQANQGSGTNGDPAQAGNADVPGLPLQPSAAVNHDQGSVQNSGAVTPNNPKKNTNTNTVGGGTGQEAAGKSSANNAGIMAPADTSNDPNSDTPAQPVIPAVPFNALTKDQVTTVNNQIVQPLSNGISIAGTTLTPGASPITHSSTVISYGSSALAIGSSTVTFASSVAKPITTTIASQVITAAPNAVALAGTTMGPGDSSMNIAGTQVAFDTAGRLVVNSNTVPLQSLNSNPFVTTIGDRLITATPAAIVVAGTTLAPGASGLTLGGTLVAADTAGRLVVNSKVILPTSTSPYITTIGSQAITATPAALAIAGTTMSAGDAGVFVNGTSLSLDTAGHFMVGSQTQTFESQSVGLGGLITGGSGTGGAVVTGSLLLPGQGQLNGTNGSIIGNGSGNGNVSSPGVQLYKGQAGGLRDSLSGLRTVMAVMAMATAIGMYISL